MFDSLINLISRKEKRSSMEDPGTPLDNSSAVSDWWSDTSDGSVVINKDTALTLSSVYGCVSILAETMATISCNLTSYKDDKKSIVRDNNLHVLVHDEPNGYMNRFDFFMYCVSRVCLTGNSYTLIVRNHLYQPTALIPIESNKVTPVLHDGSIWYFVIGYSDPFPSSDILHFKKLSNDGVVGISPIDKAKEDIQLGLTQRKFGSKFFKNGANLKGVMETDNVLKPDVWQRLKSSFASEFAGTSNSHKTPLLEQGVKYKPLSISPEQSQFLQSRKFSNTEICRWFRVAPHLLADLERSTNNNIEQQGIEFVTYSILPWATMMEQELKRKLIPNAQKGILAFKFNLNVLMRGDVTSRGEYYSKMFSIGVYSPNDILRLEDRNTYEGGDRKYVQGGFFPTDLIDEISLKGLNNKKKDGDK